MGEQTTLTVELSAVANEELGQLALRTSRPVTSLASQAIAEFARRELAIIESIERGREQVRNGQTLSHDEVFAEVWERLEAGGRLEPNG